MSHLLEGFCGNEAYRLNKKYARKVYHIFL